MRPVNSLMIMLRSIEDFIYCPVFIKSELLVLSSVNCGSFSANEPFSVKSSHYFSLTNMKIPTIFGMTPNNK
ncbi:unnamed protein product [Rhizophagus irregularis]|nr:unnamed protein product [Rhizophagus irregularis]